MNTSNDILGQSILGSEWLSYGISILLIIALVISLYYVYRSYIYFYRTSKYLAEINKEIEEKFIKAIQEGLKREIPFNKEYIFHIYEAVIQPDYAGPESNDRISYFLKKFLLNLSLGENIDVISDELVKKWCQEISKYIEIFEKESPYSDLPEAERSILIDMQNFAESKDYEAIKRKISEIANYIRVRKNDMNQMVESNERSNLYAKVGVALTILFGIISLYFTWPLGTH